MLKKIPFILVTGFLGSGKTTFISHFLNVHSLNKRILLIQNEFAESGIDGEHLQSQGWNFSLVEMNKGSVFCVCLFSDFTRTIIEEIERCSPDMILLEATGMADPIAIAQLLNAPQVKERLFLEHIYTIIDAPRFNVIGDKIGAIKHQIQVADTVVINKTDLIDGGEIELIANRVNSINPFAEIQSSTFCSVEVGGSNGFYKPQPVAVRNNIQGDLTQCNPDYVSTVFKTTTRIKRETLGAFLHSLTEETYRLKGYACLTDGSSCMIQYVPGQIQVIPVLRSRETTEMIAIGSVSIDFNRLINQ